MAPICWYPCRSSRRNRSPHADRLVAPPCVEEGVEALRPLELVQHERVRAQVGNVLRNV